MDPTTSGAHDPFAGSHVYVDPSQYNSYDNLNFFQTDADAVYNDNDWTLGETQPVARAQQPSQTWSHNGDQLPVQVHQQHAQSQHSQHQQQQSHPYLNQPAQYRNSQSKSPTPFTTNGFAAYGAQQPYSYNEPKFDPASAYKDQQLNPPNVPQQHFDPSLTQINPNTVQNYRAGAHYGSQATAAPTTFAPQALEQHRSQPAFKNNLYAGPPYQQGTSQAPQTATTLASATLRNVDEEALARAVPKGVHGGVFSIINFDDLARATNTDRFGNYVNIGKDRQEWQCTRSALPTYVPRHSRRELRELASKNVHALAKIGKKPTKVKPMISAVKISTPTPSTTRTTGSPITLKDSSSEDESSSDDDSDYSDDDDTESPLPSRKPEDPKGCIEYDTIKALWRNKRKNISSDSFKQALVDFWDIVKTIRDRWKLDSTAYAEAEEKKRTGELPLLRSRVKDQRDMFEVAFRTALKHGHRGIVELLAENSPLVFVCFQFLLDRQKADDLNGSVTRAILETMSTFTTLTEEKLEKVRLNKLLAIYQKKGDAKTQFWVKKIKANATLASKNAAEKDSVAKQSSDAPAKASDTAASSPGKASLTTTKRPEAVTGVKRAANGVSDVNPAKRIAVGKPIANGIASAVKPGVGAGAVKKPLTSAVPTSSTANTSAAPRKTVAAKPTGFFSSLSSATKKPGTSIAEKATVATGDRIAAARTSVSNAAPMAKPAFSFAETMAKLSKPKEEKPVPKAEKEVPTETNEERTKRVRKEERRKLRVRFRPDSDLVQIRLFTHDPEEELNHDASQVRDVADVGGEGRMFKQQHKLMDLDDEDDVAEEPENLLEFKEPSLVDFSVVENDERQRNYEPFGGGVLKVTSPESDERRKYEDSNLVVFYSTPDDVPGNPREPANAYTGELSEPFRPFGLPDEQYVNRARERRANKINANAPSGFNIAALAGLLSKAAPPPQQQTQQQPVMAPAAASGQMPDISSILANLRQGALAAQPQQPDVYQPPPPNVSYQAPPPPAHPPLPPANIDLAAILAALNGTNNANQQPAASAPNMNNYGSAYGSQPAWATTHGSNTHDDSEENEIAKAKAGNPAYKTKVCRFYQEGRCQKGAACSYIHT